MIEKFINDLLSNPSDFVATISSIATLITAVLTYKIINETKKQRESAYRPELYFSSSFANVLSPDFTSDIPAFSFQQERMYKPKLEKIEDEDLIKYDLEAYHKPLYTILIPIKNIGLGTAKKNSL